MRDGHQWASRLQEKPPCSHSRIGTHDRRLDNRPCVSTHQHSLLLGSEPVHPFPCTSSRLQHAAAECTPGSKSACQHVTPVHAFPLKGPELHPPLGCKQHARLPKQQQCRARQAALSSYTSSIHTQLRAPSQPDTRRGALPWAHRSCPTAGTLAQCGLRLPYQHILVNPALPDPRHTPSNLPCRLTTPDRNSQVKQPGVS